MDECSIPQQLSVGRWQDNWSETQPSEPIVCIVTFHMSEKLNMVLKSLLFSFRIVKTLIHIVKVVNNLIYRLMGHKQSDPCQGI